MLKEHSQLMRMKQQGFVLVEAMIVTSIFIFGFVATNRVQVDMIKTGQSATQEAQATQLTDSQTEQARSYSSIANYSNISSSSSTINDVNTSFTKAVTVTTQSRYKQLDQTISWTTSGGESKSISISNFISQNDPKLSGLLFSANSNSTPLPTPGSSSSSGGGSSSTTTTPTTTDVFVPGTNIVLTYNQNNQVTQINHSAAVSLTGTVSLGTGSLAPPNTILLSTLTVTPTSTNNIVNTCAYGGSSGNITCYMGSNWSGTIVLGGLTLSNAKVCGVHSQPYSNVLVSLTNQNFLIIKSTRNCPSTYPYLLQTL